MKELKNTIEEDEQKIEILDEENNKLLKDLNKTVKVKNMKIDKLKEDNSNLM
jgi:hypothetical protein